MAKPQNPFLARRDAVKESQYQGRLRAQGEIYKMAMLIAAHNKFKAGPGRAADFLLEFIAVKEKIARDIAADIGDSRKKNGEGDPEFLYTKKDLALTLKAIIGLEKWKHLREFFPMLRQYWDV